VLSFSFQLFNLLNVISKMLAFHESWFIPTEKISYHHIVSISFAESSQSPVQLSAISH